MKIKCPCCDNEINLSLFVNREIKEKELFEDRLEIIKNIVCENAGIEEARFHSHDQKKDPAKARKQYCYLAKKFTKASSKDIGAYIREGFDHSMVNKTLHSMDDLLSSYDQERREMEYLIDLVQKKLIMKLVS